MNTRDQLMNGGALAGRNVAMPAPKGQPIGPRVCLCIPSTRTWEARTSACISGVATFSAINGVSIGIVNLETSMVTKGRNDLVDQVLKHGFEYAMWIDSDMVVPPDTIIRLLKHKKDIVGATYNKRVPPYETLGKLKGKAPEAGEVLHGLFEAEQLPAGCMLVKTDVYRKLGWPWYFETYRWPGENGVDSLKEYIRHNYSRHAPEEILAKLDDIPIAAWLNETHAFESKMPWQYFSEDLNFVRKAIKAGYRVWCDMDLTYQMIHLGTLEVTCRPPQDAAPVVDAAM